MSPNAFKSLTVRLFVLAAVFILLLIMMTGNRLRNHYPEAQWKYESKAIFVIPRRTDEETAVTEISSEYADVSVHHGGV